MVHSDAIWNDVLEVGTAEKIEIKDAKWCIRALFKTIFRKLEHLSIFWKQGRKMVHSAAIWNNFYRKFESNENKEVAGSEECSQNAYCIYKAELVIQDDLYTKTWQRKQPFMKKIKGRCKL